MDQRRIRLGDVIDDYCSRCRLIMNHGVVGMVGGDVKKVRCNTCGSEHEYRQGRLPASRQRKARKLFEEVLKGIPVPAVPGRPGRPVPAGAAAEDEEERAGVDEAGDGPARAGEQVPGDDRPVDDHPGAAAARPEPTHRRLYTIRRAIAGKNAGKDPKKA